MKIIKKIFTKSIKDYFTIHKTTYVNRIKILYAKYQISYNKLSIHNITNSRVIYNNIEEYIEKIEKSIKSGYPHIIVNTCNFIKSNALSLLPKPLVSLSASTYILPYKICVTKVDNFKIENINVSDLIKDLNVLYKNLLTFLTFYKTLYY